MCRIHDWKKICYDIWEERKFDEYPSWRAWPFDIRYNYCSLLEYQNTFTTHLRWQYLPMATSEFFCLTIQCPITFPTTCGHVWRGFQRYDNTQFQCPIASSSACPTRLSNIRQEWSCLSLKNLHEWYYWYIVNIN